LDWRESRRCFCRRLSARRRRVVTEITGGVGDKTDLRLDKIRTTLGIGFIQARPRVV